MKVRNLAWSALATSVLIAAVPAAAQLGGGQGSSPGQLNRGGNRLQQRPRPKNYLTELKAIADAFAKKSNVRIVVDPALLVSGNPSTPADGLAVDKALDLWTGAIRNSAWRKVYLKASQATVLPPADKLAASVRTLDQLEHSGLVLENPTTKKVTTYVKNYDLSPTFADDLQAGQFAPAPVYVLYATNPSVDSMPAEERFADLQRQQMAMMMQMTPDELTQAMSNSMQMFMNMDPQVRQQMMGTMMKAGMQMFMNMPADQRNQLLQGFGGFPGAGGAPPR